MFDLFLNFRPVCYISSSSDWDWSW